MFDLTLDSGLWTTEFGVFTFSFCSVYSLREQGCVFRFQYSSSSPTHLNLRVAELAKSFGVSRCWPKALAASATVHPKTKLLRNTSAQSCCHLGRCLLWFAIGLLSTLGTRASDVPLEDHPARQEPRPPSFRKLSEDNTTPAPLEYPFVVTQLPAETGCEQRVSMSNGMLRAPYGDGARLVVVYPDASIRVLSQGFHSVCDPDVSFDAKRILFAGKRTSSDTWNIYEVDRDGSDVRQITRDQGNCRSPSYQSTLYTIVSPEPWYQLTFVSDQAGTANECGSAPAVHLYSCKLDGSAVRRLTFNLSSDMDPHLMSDGRLVYASWQRRTLERGHRGRMALFGVDIDGTDCALFAGEQTALIRHMPCATTNSLVIFVETDTVPWDGAGQLGCVEVRRPLHSYRQITTKRDGLFHSPSALPDGRVLVSRRPPDGGGTHAVYRLDPLSGKSERLFDDPDYHDIQAKPIVARSIPDGCSSVVTDEDPHGKLYCLNVYNSNPKELATLSQGSVKAVRVLEGIPDRADEAGPGQGVNGVPALAQRRFLGQIPVAADGSFNIEVPANTPIELQLLDADGMAIRSCGWIWAKNREPRGCIGCHEDGELTPENWFADSLSGSSISLCLPPERRRTVDFRRDLMPIVEGKCVRCHHEGEARPPLDGGLAPVAIGGTSTPFNQAYASLLGIEFKKVSGTVSDTAQRVHRTTVPDTFLNPGTARTSSLIWRIFRRNTSRPWDGEVAQEKPKLDAACRIDSLTDDERQTFVEWIDLGALWDGIPGRDSLPGEEKAK